METTTYELSGVSEVLDALDALDPKKLINLIRDTNKKVLKQEIVQPLKSAIPYQSLKRSIGMEKDREFPTGMWAGVRVTKRKDATTPPPGAVLLFLEFGTKQRTKGHNRGTITARRVVTPIVLAAPDSIIEFFNKDFGSAVEEIMKKKLKK